MSDSSSNIPLSKRIFDLFLVIPGMIILLPVFFVVAILVRIYLGKPIIFSQKRPGFQGKIFTMYKFRSMKNVFDENGKILPDNQRITRFGQFLRSSSLDELPELFNVLKGEMSLVGPRPLLVDYLPRYSAEQMRRHEALPGITGWAQINGRNAISWQEKFLLDVWYVDHRSIWLDVKILASSFWKVIKREGITQTGEVSMEEFTGN